MNVTWMWLRDAVVPPERTTATMARFRAEFTLASRDLPADPLSITADSRYRLFVNGFLAAVGPLKPRDGTWFVDEVDLVPLLQPGTNVIGVEVLHYPNSISGNLSLRRSGRPALGVSGGVPAVDLGRPEAWRCAAAPGRVFLQGVNTVFLGIQEEVDANLEPHGWLEPRFDVSGWHEPIRVARSDGDPARDPTPRPLPPLSLEPIAVMGISRSRGFGKERWRPLLDGRSVTIEPHRRAEVDLDAGVLTTAFVALQLSGGYGSRIEVTAAECYEGTPVEVPWLRVKGDRADADNGDLYGDPDIYRVGGLGTLGAPEIYRPFWFRTFRYLRIAVQTGDRPLTLGPLELTQTRYPLVVAGSFRSSSALYGRLWEVSLRTLRNCMHETFEDCPFYEQLQYAMDTRSQALFSLHLSNDDRLVRRAINDFASSGDARGLTESRAPSIQPQIIPGFSLFWIFMLAEHLEYVGDRDFTRTYLTRMHAVLDYFDAALAIDGFVLSPAEISEGAGPVEVWNFVDWTDAWRGNRGVPDLGPRRANTILTFQYVAALNSAERASALCDEPELASQYRARSDDILSRMRLGAAWDPVYRYFRDADAGAPASVHAQVWAVLAGAVTGDAAADLLSRAVRDRSLAQCSYAMSHSLFDALRRAGLHDLVDWAPWEAMLRLNLTTWAEDSVSNRSDCHAWGSVPLQHFPRWVLGVAPLSPGFATAQIDPSPSHLDYAEGSVPTPHGPIEVRWDQLSPGVLTVTARVPAAVDVVLSASSSRVRRKFHGESQVITFQHSVGVPGQAGSRFDDVAGLDLRLTSRGA